MHLRIPVFKLIVLVMIFCNLQLPAARKSSSDRYFPLVAYNFGSLGKLNPSEQIEILKTAGYNGLILNSQTKEDTLNLNFFIHALKNDRQFKIHALMVRYNFNEATTVRENWKIEVDKIAGINIELWLIFGPKTSGITDEYVETKLNEIVNYAKLKEVKVILYPHSNCIIASAEEALPFVQKINSPNLKLAVHLCHEIRAGNGNRLDQVFEKVKGFIGAVTVAGTDSVADFSKPLTMDKSTIQPIGEGNFNMQYFIQPLKKSDYKGYVGFINFKIEEDPQTYVTKSMKAWKSMFR